MKKKRNLKSILILNFSLLSIVPMIILGFIGTFSMYRTTFTELHRKNILLVDALNNEIEDFIFYNTAILKHIAQNAQGPVNEETQMAHFNSLQKNFEYFLSLQLLDQKGKLLAVSPIDNDFLGIDYSRQEYFTALTKSGGFFLSDPYIDPKTEEPAVTISVRNHDVTAAGVLRLQKLTEITRKIHVGKTGLAAIIDRNGFVIAHPHYSLVAQRTNIKSVPLISKVLKGGSRTEVYNYKGTPRIGTVKQFPSTGWVVMVAQDKKEALAPIRNLAVVVLIAAFAVASLAVISGLINSRRLISPIYPLITMANKIAGGEYPDHFTEGSYREIDELTAAFSEMKKAIRTREQELADSRKSYKNLIEHANSIIIRWDREKRITFYNEYAQDLLGYQPGELIGKPLIGFSIPATGSDGEDMDRMLDRILQSPGEYRSNENEVLTKSGKRYWIQWSNKPIYNSEGVLEEILSIGTDRTEHKHAEEQINKSLHEKEILLKEIHHRVKNNMQIVSSLLNLQASRIEDRVSQQLFQESQNRVHSMALVHEQMYQSENLAQINFRVYVEELTAYLADMYTAAGDSIIRKIEIEEILFTIDEAIPCALIINELVSNSYKYAFPGKPKTGKIEIRMVRNKDDTICLTVRDNGEGFPASFNPDIRKGMGFQLITALVDQLKGSMEMKNEKGALVAVTF